MSKHDEGGDGFDRPGRPGRSGSGDSDWTPDRGGHASGGRGGVPGKRTATQDLGSQDPASMMLARLNVARGQIRAARSTYLPALRATIADRRMQDARMAAMELRQSMSTIARELDDARQWASALGTDGAHGQVDELTTECDALRAEVEPVLALAPPPAPSIPLLTPFSFHLDTAAPPGFDEAEQRTRDQWNASLDQRAASPAAEAASPGAKVIDATSRFARSDVAAEPDIAAASAGASVQCRGGRPVPDADVQRIAADGVSGGGAPLPHLDAIQQSFGGHDVAGISAHEGGAAADAAGAIGAEAYATGNAVAFAAPPSLFVAAHEAAHVVQQRAGVSLLGGVGKAGDSYEQHADAVAERVIRGESAEDLLGTGTRSAPTPSAVQRSPSVDASAGASAPPNIELSRDSLDLGSIAVGQAGSAMVSLINNEDFVVGFPDVMVVGDQSFQCELTAGNNVEPGGYTVLRVTFKPVRVGAASAVIYVITADGTAVPVSVSAVGEAARTQPTEPTKTPQGRDRDADKSPGTPALGDLRPLSITTGFDAGFDVKQEVGERRAYRIHAWNDDLVTRYLDAVTIEGSGAFEVDSVSRTAIPSQQSTSILVSFEPTSERVEEGTLDVVAQQGPGASLTLVGRGTPASNPDKSSGAAGSRDKKPGKNPEPGKDDDAAPASSKSAELVAFAPIEFDDVEVGTAVTRTVHLFNLSHEPFVVSGVRIPASAGKFRMLETPQLMYPSREHNQRPFEHPFVIEYLPSWPGNHDTTLGFQVEGDTVGTAWVQVPIVAKSHYAGDPTYAEQQAADREAGEAKEQRDELGRRKAKDDKKTEPYPENARSGFEDAKLDAAIEAEKLFDHEAGGVETASKDADDYKRLPPKVNRSMLWDVAELALSMAIAGVAGAVAVKAGQWLKGRAVGGQASPDLKDFPDGYKGEGTSAVSDTFVKFVEDSVKELIKGGTKLVRQNLSIAGSGATMTSDESSGDASSNPRIAFFAATEAALINSSAERQHALVDMAALLRPYLRSDPGLAIDALRAIEVAFRDEANAAHDEHARRATAGWVRVVAHTALWEREAGPRGKPGTDGVADDVADVAGKEALGSKAVDGLLDIEFDVVPTSPQATVTVNRASLRGVSQEVADRIWEKMDLRSAGLPLRARCVPARMDAFPIVITRDEVGNRFVAEGDTQSRQYLARKADPRYRPATVFEVPDSGLVEAGARILLEEEILGTGRLAVGVIVTDDATGRGDE